MSPYIPILGVVAFAALLMGAMVGVSLIVGPKRYNRAKYMPYECGIDPTPKPAGGGRFPVKYYITAMLFIIFDIEIVFLYPWAVSYNQLGTFAVVEMIIFVVTVLIAYFYVLRRNGLDWE